MKFGFCIPIRLSVSIQDNLEIARRAEQSGFDSIWVSDHVVVPSKHAGTFSEVFYDPFVLLSGIAANTEKIRLGTSLIILPYRNPVVVAKMAATLDVLSGGRVIFGVGPGWMREEFSALGVPFGERGKRTDEYIEAIRELWENDRPSFNGQYVGFDNISFLPKPEQTELPIWIGGGSDKAVERAAVHGDGWQPTGISPRDMQEGIRNLERLARERGRDMEGFVYSTRNRVRIYNDPKDVPEPDEINGQSLFTFMGDIETIAGYVEDYKNIGVTHLVFDPQVDSIEEIFEIIRVLGNEILSRYKR